MKKNRVAIIVLSVYTVLNFMLVWPLFRQKKDVLINLAIQGYGTYIVILVALFLNAALVLYWLRYSDKS